MMSNDTTIASLKERIDDLNQQAWEARVSDSPKAFQLSEESVRLARSIHYPKGLAEGLRSRGFGYVRLFKNDEAAPLLRESLSLFQSLNDLKGQAIVYEYLGIIERNWGNLGASLELLLKGNELVQRTGPLEVEITSCYQVGVTYKHLGNHDLALDYLYRSLSLSKEIDLRLMEGYAINIIGSIYFDNGNYDQALDCYRQGLVIRQQSHDKWGEAGSLDNIGFTYLKLNDLDKAIDYCRQSLQITQSTNDKKGEANTLLHLAEIYQQAGDTRQATKFSNQSLEIRKLRGDKRGEAEVLLFIADLNKDNIDLNDHQIFEWISAALNIADEIKAQDLLSKAYFNLHEYYSRKGNHKESLVQLEAHLRIEKELHKNAISQKVQNLEISHKAEEIKKEAEAEKLRNKELTALNERIEKANEELKTEASLERVRAVAMGMKEPAEMINVCRMISDQLVQLGFKEIRNVQTVIIYPQKHEYLNYQYFTPYDKESIETIDYRLHPDVLEFTNRMLSSADAYYSKTFEGEELRVWREYRKRTNQLDDPKLDQATSSHYYFYSIGSGALGVTTYAALSDEQTNLFKRFRNVFELAYRRFIDIEKAQAQAREAQIELALERVRAKAMAMQEPAEFVDVINVIGEQFIHLDFDIEWVNFGANGLDITDGIDAWNFAVIPGGEPISSRLFIPRFDHPLFIDAAKQLDIYRKTGNDLFVIAYDKKDKDRWLDHLFAKTIFKDVPVEYRAVQYAKPGYTTSNLALKDTFLSIGKFDTRSFTDEQHAILKRFGNAFGQAYTRFLDLQKAEAQAREAQIEAALERVRSRTMAMHQTSELQEVIHTVHKELLNLNLSIVGGSFVVINDDVGEELRCWGSGGTANTSEEVQVPDFNLPFCTNLIEGIKKGPGFFTEEFSQGQKKEYFTKLFEHKPWSDLRSEQKNDILRGVGGYTRSVAVSKQTSIFIINHYGRKFTDAENDILKRFARVFEQTYTRFLDLQKAEAQAREAQIEAAVEKVRSRSLAMHKSDELQEVVHTVFERLKELNVDFYTAIIVLFTEGSKDITWWLESKANQHYPRMLVPFKPIPYFNDLFTIREKGADLLSKCYSFDEKNELFHHLFGNTDFKYVPENQKQFLLGAEFTTISVALSRNTGIHITSYSKKSFSDQDNQIIKRFASVFDQAYTRFLDLQKAEAQAREAQIEAGLERVRSKTMAMHKSEEVTGVAVSLNEELLKLGFQGGSTIIIINKETGDTEQWTGFSADKFLKSCYVPYFKHPSHDALLDAWKKGEKFLVYTVAGDEKKSLDEHYFTTGYKDFPESDKRWMRQMESVTFSHAFMKYGAIHWGPGHLSEEQLRILQRFSIVFEQSYTRFLDLQKAEAQTKEAQREVALERIRARAMAMHSSNELMDVAQILREQMGFLDQPDLETSVVNLFDEDSEYIHSWHAFREPGASSGRMVNGAVSFRKDSSELTREMIALYHSGKKEYTLEATGEKLHEFIHVLINSEPEIANYIGKDPPEKVYYHFATFKGGALLTVSYQPTTEDVKALQRRAASVFEMAYRRYLDLKKAEAQTREAQIEIAVERVRAKALAMHRSEEILAVVATLRNELLGLNIPGVSGTTIYLKQNDGQIRMWDLTSVIELEDGFHLTLDIMFQLEKTHPDLYIRKLWNATEKYSVQIQNRNDLMRTVEWLGEYKKEEAENVKRFIETSDLQNLFHSTVPLVNGKLSVDLMEPPPAEMGSILQKMATAFDLAYKRFLDLQKAEAQTREAQIEVAVERVRAKALAMHRSEDLHSVVVTLKRELMGLQIPGVIAATIYLGQDDGSIRMLDLSDPTEEADDKFKLELDKVFRLEGTDPDLWVRKIWEGTQNYFVIEVDEADFTRVIAWLYTIDKAGAEMAENIIREKSLKKAWLPTVKLEKGKLNIDLLEPPNQEIESILLKIGAGFDLAYKRFLDLQKAEAQAREAQIEAALERVRAKVMTMTSSKDLNATSLVFGEQLRKLGIDWQFSYFWLIEEAKNENTFWITWPDNKTSLTSYTLAEAEEYFNDCLISWRAGVKIHDNYVPPQGVQEWLDTFQRIADDAGGEAKRVMVPQTFPNGVYYYDAMMKYGSFGICISKPATDEEKNIQCRFAVEFERAYTRFLDLKQAEAQVRESQIELGLERVRARAMAMQRSDELKELIGTVSTELSKLDLILDRCFIAIFDAKTYGSKWWMSNPEAPSNPTGLSMQYHELPPYLAYLEAWKTRQLKWQYILEGDTKKEWDEFAFTQTEFSYLPDVVIANMRGNNKVFLNASFNSFGCLALATLEPLSDEHFDIMLRFAKVFDLTYTRFNDLKQAEAQARESQIELGLERVRARAMAMQKSGELKELIGTVSAELSKLDLILDRCFIMTYDIKTLGVTWWMSNPETSSDPTGLFVKYHEHTPYLAFLNAWQDRIVKWQYILEGPVKKTWDEYLFVETELSKLPRFVIDNMRANEKVYLSASFNNFGCLTLATLEPLSDEQFDIMLRFAKVFDLTYTRFNDLKQAEAQTRAAKIEAALERVRARALAMQEPEELKDVASVLRAEMGLLGVEELETCSIYINDVTAEKAECWYALKDFRSEEKKLVNDHFALNLNDTWVGREMLKFYNADTKQVSIVMTGDNRKEWIRYCEQNSAPFRGYYGETIPDRTYHLYKFSHGAIGVATPGEISVESWDLLKRAASVFSLAYSRFKDLTQARTDLIKLKEEKKRAEDAFTELQVTQKQLIQSEKMASLGELTAGIAHEIQNPLNFVNNFSDVSNELLEEMKAELATGNTQQAIEIVDNVKENLEKILHHGKRADAIVKSMLQHSRSSTGKKEPTDINSLTEEYFRLAFHGLRAKDKSFNAKFETHLDKNIGKINVISQDVGRVILNLINNAFYAVNEKKKHAAAGPASNGYEPLVTISTKKIKDKIEIKVKDNGDGIPKKVLDKIFQPFFTTKPTGQGTGLGLSLSYDIITKGHGGELFVKTKEGEGSEFIISLPVN